MLNLFCTSLIPKLTANGNQKFNVNEYFCEHITIIAFAVVIWWSPDVDHPQKCCPNGFGYFLRFRCTITFMLGRRVRRLSCLWILHQLVTIWIFSVEETIITASNQTPMRPDITCEPNSTLRYLQEFVDGCAKIFLFTSAKVWKCFCDAGFCRTIERDCQNYGAFPRTCRSNETFRDGMRCRDTCGMSQTCEDLTVFGCFCDHNWRQCYDSIVGINIIRPINKYDFWN